MSFYLKKSISAGSFRFNFSKSGVGVSTGIPGLRVGMGPRGNYIHMGKGGLYYRKSLGGQKPANQSSLPSGESVENTPKALPEMKRRCAWGMFTGEE